MYTVRIVDNESGCIYCSTPAHSKRPIVTRAHARVVARDMLQAFHRATGYPFPVRVEILSFGAKIVARATVRSHENMDVPLTLFSFTEGIGFPHRKEIGPIKRKERKAEPLRINRKRNRQEVPMPNHETGRPFSLFGNMIAGPGGHLRMVERPVECGKQLCMDGHVVAICTLDAAHKHQHIDAMTALKVGIARRPRTVQEIRLPDPTHICPNCGWTIRYDGQLGGPGNLECEDCGNGDMVPLEPMLAEQEIARQEMRVENGR